MMTTDVSEGCKVDWEAGVVVVRRLVPSSKAECPPSGEANRFTVALEMTNGFSLIPSAPA